MEDTTVLPDYEAEAARIRRDMQLHPLSPEERNAHWLRMKLDAGMRHLRDAEDWARTRMPAWPTADRIRFIHEQITDDILTGKTTQPTQLEDAVNLIVDQLIANEVGRIVYPASLRDTIATKLIGHPYGWPDREAAEDYLLEEFLWSDR